MIGKKIPYYRKYQYQNFLILSRISITTEGKYAAVEAGCIRQLIPRLNDASSEVRLNAVKVRFSLFEA